MVQSRAMVHSARLDCDELDPYNILATVIHGLTGLRWPCDVSSRRSAQINQASSITTTVANIHGDRRRSREAFRV
jgi:hypothetical protein